MVFETHDPFLIRQVRTASETCYDLKLLDSVWCIEVACIAIMGDSFICWYKCVQERENPTLTEWDRFAHREYIRLSLEELIKMLKMLLMEVQKFGMNHLRLLFEFF